MYFETEYAVTIPRKFYWPTIHIRKMDINITLILFVQSFIYNNKLYGKSTDPHLTDYTIKYRTFRELKMYIYIQF